jgi:hypothetical protein
MKHLGDAVGLADPMPRTLVEEAEGSFGSMLSKKGG